MEDYSHRHKSSGSLLAWILVIFGAVLLLKHAGWSFNIPGIGPFFTALGGLIGDVFHFLVRIGWPVLLILAGIVLLTGRRLLGTLLLILLLFLILPHFLLLPGILLIVFFPLILIIAGIVILTKLF